MGTITSCEDSLQITVSYASLLKMCQELGRKGAAVRNAGGRIVCDNSPTTSLAQDVEELSCRLDNGLLQSRVGRSACRATEKGNRVESHWKFVVDNEHTLRILCRKHARGGAELADDLFSYCVERIPGIFKTYDETKASIRTHVFSNLNWYVYKWVKQRQRPHQDRNQERFPEGWDTEATVNFNLDTSDEVNYILKNLSQYDRLLLMMKHIQGLTFKEIAEVTEQSLRVVRNHYLAAMQRARVIVGEVVQ